MEIRTFLRNDDRLPLVVEPIATRGGSENLLDVLATKAGFFQSSLLTFGALLLRGFDVPSIETFQECVRCFSGKELLNYAGGVSPRTSLGSGVYTSTEYPSHLTLSLHNELSYSKTYPKHLYFYCAAAPERGGETTLGDSRRILNKIPCDISAEFKHKGVLYVRNLTANGDSGYNWQDAFETSLRETVEEHCCTTGAEWEWQSDGGLRLSQRAEATTVHPETGEEVWFNQAHGFHPTELEPSIYKQTVSAGGQFRLESYYGDGSPIDKSTLDCIRMVLRKETVKHKWQQNDVLILDNTLAAHGRMPVLSARRIVLAMT